jgi:hypothetical protein
VHKPDDAAQSGGGEKALENPLHDILPASSYTYAEVQPSQELQYW